MFWIQADCSSILWHIAFLLWQVQFHMVLQACACVCVDAEWSGVGVDCKTISLHGLGSVEVLFASCLCGTFVQWTLVLLRCTLLRPFADQCRCVRSWCMLLCSWYPVHHLGWINTPSSAFFVVDGVKWCHQKDLGMKKKKKIVCWSQSWDLNWGEFFCLMMMMMMITTVPWDMWWNEKLGSLQRASLYKLHPF